MNSNLIGYIAGGLSVLALFISILSMSASVRAFRQASIRNLRLTSVKRVTAIEAELTEIVDSISALHDTLKKLRSRISMRNLRAKQSGDGDDIPDSRVDPDGWKRAMRLRLHNQSRK